MPWSNSLSWWTVSTETEVLAGLGGVNVTNSLATLSSLDILTNQSVAALCSTKETLPAMEESLQWDPATEGEDTATELCRAS